MLIGIQVSGFTPDLAERAWGSREYADLNGVIVTDVKRFGPGSNAGLVPGWLIQEVNEKTVESVQDFDEVLSSVEPGDVVSIKAVAPDSEGGLTHRIINMTVPERE